MSHNRLFSRIVVTLFSVFTCQTLFGATPPLSAEPEDCATCHLKQTKAWERSHHKSAMAIAAPMNNRILGDFDNAQATHKGLSANFLTIDGHPVMALTRDKKTTHHVISEAFGAQPLQQYLTKTENGARQVLPFSWDSRDASDGGQRWMTLYPNEDIKPADRLHWKQPLANWNGMCADCHSTGLVRNFSVDSFATQYSAVNVSCGSCHGSVPHDTNPIAKGSSAGFTPRHPLTEKLPAQKLSSGAHQDHQAASKKTMEVCAACHSLRAPLVDGFNPEVTFLDQFTPSLPNPALYFADGQIREEVYVWGSFLQSRMHQEGVTCGNCHEPHSQQLKAKGNALCGQCHLASQYDNQDHHRHDPASTGAQCINCHMTSRTYMVVDDRRDHSFRVPDLEASKALQTPDPCTACHQAKTQDWASNALNQWPGYAATIEEKSRSRITLGTSLEPAAHKAFLNNKDAPEILRAASLTPSALAGYPQAGAASLVQQAVSRDEPLIALAATNSAALLPLQRRIEILTPLLNHPFRAIRVAAANQLRDWQPAKAHDSNSPFNSALKEADEADEVSSWRGEGLLNKALHAQQSGNIQRAINSYRQSILIDPYFEPSYINLTDLYRREGDTRREQLLYTDALRTLPRSALLRYSYALHLVRRKETAQAVQQTSLALDIEPTNSTSAYLHLLLLDNLGKTAEAVRWLNAHLEDQRESPEVLQIGAKYAQKQSDEKSYQRFINALQEVNRIKR